jgi:hypothetical protein
MIKKEKQEEAKAWYISDSGLKFRLKDIDENRGIMWISSDGRDMCFTLMVCDFFDHCREEVFIELHADRSWDGRAGFIYKKEDESFLMAEADIYIDEFDFKPRNMLGFSSLCIISDLNNTYPSLGIEPSFGSKLPSAANL